MIAPWVPSDFFKRISGSRIELIRRRGKFIVVSLSSGLFLLLHLRMTGQLSLVPESTARDRHQHLIFKLDCGRELRFRDTRKFGRCILTDCPSQILDRLGVEPLAPVFTVARLTAGLRDFARQLKPLLLDQSFIAGLGNICVDESLWGARLHPLRRADSLSNAEIRMLRNAIRRTLLAGIRYGGTSLGSGPGNFMALSGQRGRNQNRLRVFRRTGEPCPRCGALIRRLVVAQRSTHICPECQHGNY